MKTKLLLIIVILSFLNAPIFGQANSDVVNENYYKNKYALGVGVGYTTGYGISFKFTPNKFGVQCNFAPAYTQDYTQISVGLTFLYTLIEAEITNFYLYQGNHFIYDDYNTNYSNRETIYFNNGIGLGIEFIILKCISLNVMGGYAFYDDFERLGFTGETGLYYKF